MKPKPEQIVRIAVDRIVPSKTNPRRRMDAAGLAELEASIKAHGVLQPILVRFAKDFEVSKGKSGKKEGFWWFNHKTKEIAGFYLSKAEAQKNPPLELIAGERRWRAARNAELETIPAVVLEVADQQAAEIQIVENEEREDVSPLEKAAGYDRLMKEHKVSIDQVAARIGKSANTVRNLLRLLQLPPAAAEALEKGELPASTAGLIARIPGPMARRDAAESILCNYGQGDKAGPMSFRAAKALVERSYMIELKQAPFNQKDKALVPGIGPCTTCPKRAGNLAKEDPEAYAGVRADVCTDTDCYQAKCKAWSAKEAEQLRKEGVEVLDASAKWKLFSTHIALSDRCWQAKPVGNGNGNGNGSCPTWCEVLKGRLDKERVAILDEDGRLEVWVPRRKAEELVEGKKPKQSPPPATAGRLWPDSGVERKVQIRTLELVGEELVRRGQGVASGAAEPFLKVLLSLELDDWLENGDSEELQELLKRQGLPLLVDGVGKDIVGERLLLDPWIRDKATTGDTLALLTAAMLCRLRYQFWMNREKPGLSLELLKFAGVDLEGLERQARQEIAPPATTPAASTKGKKIAEEEPAHV